MGTEMAESCDVLPIFQSSMFCIRPLGVLADSVMPAMLGMTCQAVLKYLCAIANSGSTNIGSFRSSMDQYVQRIFHVLLGRPSPPPAPKVPRL